MSAKEQGKLTVSVIMPVHNGISTLEQTIQSLFKQSQQPDEIIIIDDASRDGSLSLVKNILANNSNCIFVSNEKQGGLAATYNQGIKLAKSELIITLHQDILLEKDAIKKIIDPFTDENIVASTHVVDHPLEIWNNYNFWQKCFFARLAGKKFSGIDGKFDCFRKKSLEKIGMFDEVHFRTAGEDGSIVYNLKKIGKIANSGAQIVHLHQADHNFSWSNIIYKQAQYSEAQGVLLRLGMNKDVKNIIKTFFREILLIMLGIPYLRYAAIVVSILYSFWYTKIVYLKEYNNPRILILPILNLILLIVSLFFSLKGFLYGKQRI